LGKSVSCFSRTFSDPATPDDPANPIITVLHLRVDKDRSAVRGIALRQGAGRTLANSTCPRANSTPARGLLARRVIRTTGIAVIVFTAVTVLAVFALNQSHQSGKPHEPPAWPRKAARAWCA
jgi:hypothetical protein